MDTRHNSICYDAEKQELHIVTCYNKLQYKTLWVQDQYIRYARYLMYAKDPEVRRLPTLRGYWIYLRVLRGVFALLAVLCLLQGIRLWRSDVSQSLLPIVLAACMLVLACMLGYYAICTQAIVVRSSIQTIHRTKVPKPLRRTWEGIDQGFAAQPVFRQEVTITPEGHSLNTPYPDTPFSQFRRGEYFIRVVAEEKDLYFLQIKDRKNSGGYLSPAGLHFVKDNYSDTEWTVLLTALREMQYL